MQQSLMLHLQELREAHAARLRVLEVQFAQFGVNCPAHIKVEIEQIQKALAAIEKQAQDPFPAESAHVAQPDFRSTRSFIRKISFHIAYGITAWIVIALLLRAFFKLSVAEMPGA